jgi:predicted Zn-dependent protease
VTLRWRTVFLLTLLLVPSARAFDAPVRVATPGSRPAPGSDEAALWYAMDKAERELQLSPQLVRDPALNAYVRGVACKVAADYCADLRVYIVEQPWFNAMMAPNGMLIVWTGALLRARNEAELAFVIGHEAGHYRAQHVIAQWRHSKNVSAWTSAFEVASTGAGASIANPVGSLASSAALSSFSREQESEADSLGFTAMVARGYDPQAAVELWARMLREENTKANGKSSSMFSSHPPTRERLDAMRAQAAALGAHGTERDLAAYRAATHPFLQQWLDAELTRRQDAASILVVSELLADAPPEDKALLSFYLGEAFRRRANAGDREEAARWYAQAIALPNPPVAAWREHGMAMRDAGQNHAAADALRRYLDLAGDAPDRAFVEHDLAELHEHAP